MVARLLQQAGLYLGPEDQLLGPDSANPDGHFEHTGFLEINDALLRRLGGYWDVPPPTDTGWELHTSIEDIRDKAKSLVVTLARNPPWGWKDPRTTILLSFWKSIISNLRFVICVRNPLSVAKSLVSRNQMTIDHAVYLWSQYMRAAIRDTEGYPRCLVFYENFFDDRTTETDRLFKFCRLEHPTNQSAFESGVRGELRHHDSGISELLDDPSVSLYSKLLYIGLRSLSTCGSVSTGPQDESSKTIGRFLKVLDEFRSEAQLGELETALSNLRYETNSKLKERDLEITMMRNQLSELQQHADRLQKFSDAVRETWIYRLYRNFIKPIRSN